MGTDLDSLLMEGGLSKKWGGVFKDGGGGGGVDALMHSMMSRYSVYYVQRYLDLANRFCKLKCSKSQEKKKKCNHWKRNWQRTTIQ